MRPTPRWPAGTVLQARHKAKVYEATVIQADGSAFRAEYAGQEYTSLSAMGKAVTGGSVNGHTFWRPEGEEAPAPLSRSAARRQAAPRGQPRPEFSEVEATIDTTELPDAYRVHDGYVPETPSNKGEYPTANPKLGPKPDWFKESSHGWIIQCSGCDLLVVAVSRHSGTFDDYDCKEPHLCTHRKPGESVDAAQRRLTHAWYVIQDVAARRKARGEVAVVEEEDGVEVASDAMSTEESEDVISMVEDEE
jgi:hypothetical protein